MKRRNFIAALLALPFAAKMSDELIGISISDDVDWLEPRLALIYERHTERIMTNREEIRRLREALQNAPKAWRVSQARFSKTDMEDFARAAKRFRKLPEASMT